MIETVKMKLLAAIIKMLSNVMTNQSIPEEEQNKTLCQEASRLEVMAEATAIGSHNLLCENVDEESEFANICWKQGHEQLAFNMISMAFYETKFMERIHAGNCLSNECDPVFAEWKGNKYVQYHRARTPWQLHDTIYVAKDEWDTMVGTDLESTIVAATVASRVFTFTKNRCGSDLGGFSLYATGKRCSWTGAYNRVATAWKYRKLAKNKKWVSKRLARLETCE